MNADKNDPASKSDQKDGQVENLESTEIEDVYLETVSGGMTISPVKVPTATCGCPQGYTI